MPYDLTTDSTERHRVYTARLDALLREGRHGDAFALAMRTWGAPEDAIRGARASPIWPSLEALAPTLAHDARVMGTNQPPLERLARITQPTMVLTGAPRVAGTRTGGAAPGFFDAAADAIAAAIPGATRDSVPGQEHVVDALTFSPVLVDFFLERPESRPEG